MSDIHERTKETKDACPGFTLLLALLLLSWRALSVSIHMQAWTDLAGGARSAAWERLRFGSGRGLVCSLRGGLLRGSSGSRSRRGNCGWRLSCCWWWRSGGCSIQVHGDLTRHRFASHFPPQQHFLLCPLVVFVFSPFCPLYPSIRMSPVMRSCSYPLRSPRPIVAPPFPARPTW